jgi:integrase
MKLDAKTAAVLGLPAGKCDVIYFDNDVTGFGLRVRLGAGGKILRTWIAQYRRAGASRRLLIGKAEVVTAEAARKAAKKALAAVALGQDPQAGKADRRSADRLTFAKAVAEFLEIKRQQLRPYSFRETNRYLTGAHFRALHHMPLDSISRQDVATCIVRIARERGSPTAAQARSKLSGFYTWAMQMGLAEANPTIGTIRPKENAPRDRVLSDDELAAVWKACGDDDYGKVVRLLILTAGRREEIGGMRWGEIDLDKGIWTLPAERSKNHRQHALPLTPTMRGIIESVPRMVSREHLFGEHSPKGFGAWNDGKAALDHRSGVRNWKLHDIRRSVATKMADIGIMPHIIEAVLNHQSGHKGGIAGVYNRSSYEREVRTALALWESRVHELVEGGERRVVSFKP